MNEQKAVTEFDKGNQLLQDGKVEDAIAAYCCAIELDPANSWFHHQLGEALAKQGRLDEAVAAFCSAIELKPDFSWSHHYLGDALAKQQKWKEATDAFGKGIELNPQHFGTYCGLGQSLEKLGLLDEAIAAYRRASELNPDADWIYHALASVLQKRTQSDLAQAITSYRQMIAFNPDNVEAYHNLLQIQQDNSETWLQLAEALVRKEKIEEAIASYRRAILNPRAIEVNPKSFLLHQQFAKALSSQGDVAGAIAAYRHAIELNPKSVELLEDLWAQLSRPRQWEQAVDIYRQILEANPDMPLAHYHLGAALAYLCRWEEASASYQRAIELNLEYSFWPHQLLGSALAKQGKLNEAIVAYQNGLEIQPNGPGYFELGLLFVEDEHLNEALLCYQKAVDIEPNQAQAYSSLLELVSTAYHQLGVHQAEQSLLDEAIASYLEAVKISPETFDYCHRLGELLARVNQPEHWEKAINTYEYIIAKQPESSNAYHFLGDIFRYTQQWEKAKGAYFRAIELSPERDILHHFLAHIIHHHSTTTWEDAVEFYRHVIAIHPQIAWFHYHLGALFALLSRLEEAVESYQRAIAMNVAPNSFWPYYLLGNALLRLGNVDDAIKSYQKAFESEPTENFYQTIEQLLLQNNYLEEAVKWHQNLLKFNPKWAGLHSNLHKNFIKNYYDLGFQKAKEGRLNEAISCFHAAENRPTNEEIYEQIWKGLNKLAPLNENNPYYPSEVKWQQPYYYFSHASTNKYRVIYSYALNDDDENFLENSGFSIDYLKLIGLDDVDKEKIFIQSFQDSPDVTSLFDEEVTCLFTGKGRFFQQSIVETGYIYSLCPVTGQILRTNQSFPLQCAAFLTRTAYRFVGQEVFYLIAGSWLGDIEYIYFPRVELIFVLAPSFDTDGRNLINELKALMVSCWQSVKKYINSNQREIAVTTAFFANFGHQLSNEFTGIATFFEKGTIHKIDKFIVGEYEHFNVADIFPGVSQQQIVRLERDKFLPLGIDILFKTTIENSYFVVRLSQSYIKETLAQLMYKGGLKRSSQQVLQEVEEVKQHFPILCIQIRSHYRLWLSQIEGTANIIKAIHADFPNLAVVFDGWSIGEMPDTRSLKGIEEDGVIIEKIRELLPPNIQTYSASGRTTWETVVWANSVDLFMAPIGAGGMYLVGLARKKGVMYSNRTILTQISQDYKKIRENVILPIFVPIDSIYDDLDAIDSNFDLDWQIIYYELKKIIDIAVLEKMRYSNGSV